MKSCIQENIPAGYSQILEARASRANITKEGLAAARQPAFLLIRTQSGNLAKIVFVSDKNALSQSFEAFNRAKSIDYKLSNTKLVMIMIE